MKRPWLLSGIMLAFAAASFMTADGLDVGGVPQVFGFVFSVVVAGFCAIRGLQSNHRWSQGAGTVVVLYLAWIFYMLLIW